MARSIRTFSAAMMNKDLDERLVPKGQYRDALNIDVSSGDDSNSGAARNKKGNTKVQDLSSVCGYPVDSSFRTIGAIPVEAERKIYYLVSSNYFDGVFEYNEISDTITRVLQSDKATPTTPSKLNFNPDYYVTGFNYIDGLLFWTDNYNEPFGGNISRWKSYSIDDPRIDDDIRVIKAPPMNAPTIYLTEEQDEENNIEKRFIQFAYRYKYVDNQYSSLSPFSGVSFDAGSFQLDYAAGNNKAMANTKNEVEVTFETGNRFVKSIQLVFRDSKNLNVVVVEEFKKEVLNIANNYSYKYKFANNKTYTVLGSDQLTRLFDNVPLKAKSQDIIERRLVYGNYTQFYDVINEQGVDLPIKHSVRYISSSIEDNNSKRTFRSDRDYEIGVVYGDDYGRLTTVLTTPSNSTNSTYGGTVYVKPENSIHANSIVVEIDNEPPTFATHYRVVIKQSKSQYYNVFPILYYSQSVYRYFLINQSDIDKIKVGEYIIFKSNADGPTLSNKKYKILEIDVKSKDFLNNGSYQSPGLYFKIKVDSGDFPQSSVQSFSMSAYGANDASGVVANFSFQCNQDSFTPVDGYFKCTEPPIFYGSSSNGSSLTISNNWEYLGLDDLRVVLEIYDYLSGSARFRYRFVGTNTTASTLNSWSSPQVIVPNTNIVIQSGTGVSLFNIQFSTQIGYDIGDSWRINCRGDISDIYSQNIFGGRLKLLIEGGVSGVANKQHGGFAIVPNDNFPQQINAGAQIKFWIYQDSPSVSFPDQSPHSMTFYATREYENIEEWFFEDEIYTQWTQVAGNTGSPTGAASIYFRRGTNWGLYTVNTGYKVNTINQGGSQNSLTVNYPARMIIRGYNTNDKCNQNRFIVNFYVTQIDGAVIAETEPIDSDQEIFHEITDTYPIEDGLHKVQWKYDDFQFDSGNTKLVQLTPTRPHKFVIGDRVVVDHSVSPSIHVQSGTYTVVNVPDAYEVTLDIPWVTAGSPEGGKIALEHETLSGTELELDQTSTTPAVIVVGHPDNPNNTHNAFSFGNGLESNRVLDDFNETVIEYSPRVMTTVDTYEEEVKKSSLCYSNIYRGESSINRLNEFNLSVSNFKNLDVEFGPVQKLHARDTDLLVFQENKVSKVLYGKNLLSDAVGGGTITSVPQVLGTQVPYAGEWGISTNPESFARWANEIFFTDARRGEVLKMTTGGIVPIVDGMSDYFRDLFMDNPDTMKMGIYDPYNDQYILASNDNTSNPCDLYIDRQWRNYDIDGASDTPGTISNNVPDFTIYSNTEWTISVSYSSGSGWVTGYPQSGSGNQDVYLGLGYNSSGSNRVAVLTITYCGGLTKTFKIYQSIGKDGEVITIIYDTIDPDINTTL